MAGQGVRSDGDRIGEVVTRVQLPLENLEFALDSYIEDNGSFLDKRTRAMLISVREGLHRVALSARALGSAPGASAADTEEVSAAGEQEAEERSLAMLSTGA